MFHVKHENLCTSQYAITQFSVFNCSSEVKCSLFKSFCTNMYCCPLWFNSTTSSVKKLKCSYNSVLRCLLYICMPYSASAMFVTHGISSFYELLRKCIYNFSEY